MSENTKPIDNGPFRNTLKENLFDDTARGRVKRLQGLEGHEELVVRAEDPVGVKNTQEETGLSSARANYQSNQKDSIALMQYREALDKHYEIDQVTTYREYLKTLDKDYGIKNSGFMPVIGKELDALGAQRYIVTNKIEGPSGLYNLDSIPIPALITTWRRILAHSSDVYKHGGAIKMDLNFGQFVYDEDLEEMVLVDLEPRHLVTGTSPHNEFLRTVFYDELLRSLDYIVERSGKEYPDLKEEIRKAFNQ